MQQWEYKRVPLGLEGMASRALADFGDEGWELVAVVRHVSYRDDTANAANAEERGPTLEYIFKRPKP